MTRSLLLPVLLLLAVARAEDPPTAWFPLEVGTTWTYRLEIVRGEETQSLQYTTKVTRRDDLEGVSYAVLEARSGDRLLETSWFTWTGTCLLNPRRQSGRSVQELRQKEGAGPRVVLDVAAIGTMTGTAEGSTVAPRRWEWVSADGAAHGAIELQAREKLIVAGLGERDCLLLVETAEFQSGGQKATQERRLWIAAGLGLVRERSKIVVGGAETTTDAVLEKAPER